MRSLGLAEYVAVGSLRDPEPHDAGVHSVLVHDHVAQH